MKEVFDFLVFNYWCEVGLGVIAIMITFNIKIKKWKLQTKGDVNIISFLFILIFIPIVNRLSFIVLVIYLIAGLCVGIFYIVNKLITSFINKDEVEEEEESENKLSLLLKDLQASLCSGNSYKSMFYETMFEDVYDDIKSRISMIRDFNEDYNGFKNEVLILSMGEALIIFIKEWRNNTKNEELNNNLLIYLKEFDNMLELTYNNLEELKKDMDLKSAKQMSCKMNEYIINIKKMNSDLELKIK